MTQIKSNPEHCRTTCISKTTALYVHDDYINCCCLLYVDGVHDVEETQHFLSIANLSLLAVNCVQRNLSIASTLQWHSSKYTS